MAVDTSDPRTRRSFLVAAAGGLVGLAAGVLGRPLPAEAANGSPVLLGRTGSATTTTTISTTSGTGLQGKSSYASGRGVIGAATRTSGSTIGAYGTTASPSGDGVRGLQNAAAGGSGAAVRAVGNKNDGLVATAGASSRAAVRATATGEALALRAVAPGRVAEIRRTGPEAGPALIVTDDTTGATPDVDPGTPGAVLIGTDGIAGLAIHARNTASEGSQAIYARADGGNVAAVWGANYTGWPAGGSPADGYTGGAGVSGESDSPDGFGIWGAGTVGVRGVSNNNGPGDNVGVWGEAPVGVRGTSAPLLGASAIGVHGVAHVATALAGYFEGQLATTHSLLLHEQAAPSSPPAHQVRLFARPTTGNPDKLELCVQFDSGPVVVLATQG